MNFHVIWFMIKEAQFLKAGIPNKAYFDAGIFNKEKTDLFRKVWYYVGLTLDLEHHQDFITVKVGGLSVVVQNHKGTLKAFHNVCTHRFNKIKSAKCGSGPLACPYHGWNYNQDGIPFGIPLKKEFQGLDKETLNSLRLQQFKLETCGSFVFVNVSNDAVSLSEFLGESAARLQEISKMIGRKIEYHEIPNAANWKIVIENTLEGYHISSVHPHTFFKQGFNLKSAVDFESAGMHTAMILHRSDTILKGRKREKFNTFIKDRPFQPDGFFHQLIFPNLSIGSLFGITVYIGTIQPISEGQSVFSYSLYETNLGDGRLLDEAISEVIKFSSIEFTRTTLAEDREICETVHRGVMQTSNEHGVLNSIETRIWDFQKAYQNYIHE